MIDISKIKPGVKIKVKDGAILHVRGSYLSVEGLIIRAKPDPSGPYERNCPLGDIEEILQEGGQ